MSTTHRSDTGFVPGYHHSGDRGLGVKGSTIPSSGVNGPALLYAGLSLPAEANSEFYIVFLTIPAGVTFITSPEDSSLSATAIADGVYTGTYQAFKDGISYGTSTYSLSFGDGLAGSITLDDLLASGGASGPVSTYARAGKSSGPRFGLTSKGDLIVLL